MIDKNRYGPWAVIAGASEGVGAAFARQLGEAGINLVLIARNQALLEQLGGEIRQQSGVQVRVLPLDLGREDLLARVREITDDIQVGLVVCNAAAGAGRFLDSSLNDALHAMRVNNAAQVSLAHHFAGSMVQRGRGGVILVGSLAGNAGGATTAIYSASKAFSQHFAEGLWSELKPQGVDVLYMVLGATNTPVRARQNLQDDSDQFIAEPEDVARDGLAHIADGPVFVPSHMEQAFKHFSGTDRREAAETMTNLLLSYRE